MDKIGEENDSSFFLKEYEFSSLKNIRKLPGVNNLCRIYDGVLEEKSEDEDITIDQNVFLVCFKIFENDEDTIQKLKTTMQNSEKQINQCPELKYFFLTRCGFAQNKYDQSFYLIYVNNGNKLINLEQFHKNNKKYNNKLIRLLYFKQFLNFVTKLHENKMRVAILNPNMIFHSKICGYQLFGYFFYEFFKDYDFVQNFPLAIYFGYFDPEILSEINRDDSLRYKADIVLMCILLGYLFSYDNSKSEDDIIFIPYGRIIFQLHADFISHDKTFSRFLGLVQDEEVKEYLLSILNLNYSKIPDINKCRELFNIIVDKNLQSMKCLDCKYGSKHANRMNFLCKEFLCNDCHSKHECRKIKEIILLREFEKFTLNKIYLDNLVKSFSEIPPISDQAFEYYFNKELKAKFQRIANEHQKVERYTKMQENKINNMIEYIETCHRNKIKALEDEILSIKEEIKKSQSLRDSAHEKAPEDGQESIIYKFEPPKGSLIDNPMVLKIINTNNNTVLESKKFEDKLLELKNLLEISKNAKKSLNFNIRFNSAMDNLKYKSQIYLDQLKNEFMRNFGDTVNRFIVGLNDLYEKAELANIKPDNINYANIDKDGNVENTNDVYQLYLVIENKFVATVDIKQNLLIIINHEDKEDKKFKPIYPDDYGPEPKNILQLCRWVNVKNRLFITGGIYRDKEGKESCSKKAFFIEYDSEIKETRGVHLVKDMIEGRDQHCLIYVNDYYIIAISGFRTKSCEQYNILRDEWTQLPSLDVKLYNTSAVLFNSINIYLFFGLISPPKSKNDLNFSHDIYRLKLFSEKNSGKWEKISYNYTEKIYLCLNALLNVNESEIYIIGGRNQGDNNFSNLTFCFDPFTGNITQNKVGLVKKLCFLESNFIKIPNQEYALYSSDFHFVKFKI